MTGCDFSAGLAIVQPEVGEEEKGKSRESSVPVLNYLKSCLIVSFIFDSCQMSSCK